MCITDPRQTSAAVLEFKRRVAVSTLAVVLSVDAPQTVSHYVMTPRGVIQIEHRAPAGYSNLSFGELA